MKHTPFWTALVLAGAVLLTARPATAQDTGAEDQASEIAQLFGQGSGLRGIITAAGAGNFLVRTGQTGLQTGLQTGQGETYKVFYSPNTRIVKDRQPIGASEIHVGDELIAAGQLDKKAKTMGAVFLYDVDAAEVHKAMQGLGKTWTAGKVTSIHDLSITIAVINSKQTQKITVDENTSFRKQKESVTLGDIKVGDFISARGALHDGAFLATVLRVMNPGAGMRPGFAQEPGAGDANDVGSAGP